MRLDHVTIRTRPMKGIVRPCIQRPNASSGPLRVHCVAPQNPVDPRQTSRSTAASTGWRSVMLEPFWERPAGTQTHSRRTGERLGRLQRVRQGLVRVPESNTKYGGNGGKTGGTPGPRHAQLSVSPEGFPSEKNPSPMSPQASSRCSQAKYFFPSGLACPRLT